MSPIVILASERSGTNLLRTLLNNHSQIAAPAAPHLYHTFFRYRNYYGDLRKPGNIARLLGDFIGCVNHPFHAWGLETPVAEIVAKHRPESFQSAIRALWQTKAETEGKTSFASKDINNFTFATQIKSECPSVRFVYLARDPRDVVASWMKRPISHFTAYNAARHWMKEQSRCFQLFHHLGIQAHTLYYEDLITHPDQVMTDLLTFLGEEVEAACFSTSASSAEVASRNPYWENIANPVMSDNHKKYQSELKPEEVEMVETICAAGMNELGYRLETEGNWQEPEGFAAENRKIADERRQQSRVWMADEMPLLLDRWKFGEDLKRRLTGDDPNQSEHQAASDPLQDRSLWYELRQRMRFSASAIFGESRAAKLAAAFRRKRGT